MYNERKPPTHSKGVIVFIHGLDDTPSGSLPSSAHRFFCAAGYHVYLPELRYRNWMVSSPGSGARFISRYISTTYDWRETRVHLIGHSLGSHLALAVAAMLPDIASLTLWDPSDDIQKILSRESLASKGRPDADRLCSGLHINSPEKTLVVMAGARSLSLLLCRQHGTSHSRISTKRLSAGDHGFTSGESRMVLLNVTLKWVKQHLLA